MKIDARAIWSLLLVLLIVGLSACIALLYYSRSQAISSQQVTIERPNPDERHRKGDPRAPIKLIEFSDYQCPYCARLHPHLQRLITEKDGLVSWEYRHLPLPSHPLARPTAVVLECVAQELGEDAFWLLTDTIFEYQEKLTMEFLTEMTEKMGLSQTALATCQADSAIADKIKTDEETARLLGGSGTPFTVILYPDNTYKTITGANRYEQWLSLVE